MSTKGGLPEHTTYRDDGCDLQPACLSCSLPRCRMDLPPGVARAILQARQLHELLAEGLTMDQAAVALRLSRRQTYRLRKMDTQGGMNDD